MAITLLESGLQEMDCWNLIGRKWILVTQVRNHLEGLDKVGRKSNIHLILTPLLKPDSFLKNPVLKPDSFLKNPVLARGEYSSLGSLDLQIHYFRYFRIYRYQESRYLEPPSLKSPTFSESHFCIYIFATCVSKWPSRAFVRPSVMKSWSSQSLYQFHVAPAGFLVLFLCCCNIARQRVGPADIGKKQTFYFNQV